MPASLLQRHTRLFVLALLLLARTACGAEVAGLYSASVPVAGQDKALRDAALSQALSEVVVKVSGSRDAPANPVVAGALKHPGQYVQQFGYGNAPPAAVGGGAGAVSAQAPAAGNGTTATASTATLPAAAGSTGGGSAPVKAAGNGAAANGAAAQGAAATAGGGSPQPSLQLTALFDHEAVDAMLRQAHLPVWGRVRPLVLVWLAVERDGTRALVGSEDSSGLAALMQADAARRGVPLILPLLDLEDRARVKVDEVWVGYPDAVREASTRYGAEAVAVARAAQRSGSGWDVRWTLDVDGHTSDWSSDADTLAAALDEGVNRTADTLAASFALPENGTAATGVDITIFGVNSLADYARVMRFVSSLEQVTRVDVSEVRGDRLSLHVDTRAGAEALGQVLALGSTLTRDEGEQGLAFQLQP